MERFHLILRQLSSESKLKEVFVSTLLRWWHTHTHRTKQILPCENNLQRAEPERQQGKHKHPEASSPGTYSPDSHVSSWKMMSVGLQEARTTPATLNSIWLPMFFLQHLLSGWICKEQSRQHNEEASGIPPRPWAGPWSCSPPVCHVTVDFCSISTTPIAFEDFCGLAI